MARSRTCSNVGRRKLARTLGQLVGTQLLLGRQPLFETLDVFQQVTPRQLQLLEDVLVGERLDRRVARTNRLVGALRLRPRAVAWQPTGALVGHPGADVGRRELSQHGRLAVNSERLLETQEGVHVVMDGLGASGFFPPAQVVRIRLSQLAERDVGIGAIVE